MKRIIHFKHTNCKWNRLGIKEKTLDKFQSHYIEAYEKLLDEETEEADNKSPV